MITKFLNEMAECLFLHVFRVRCWAEPARLPTPHKMSPATLADFSRASSNQLLMITWPLPPTLVMMSSIPAHRNTPLSSLLYPDYPLKSILSSFCNQLIPPIFLLSNQNMPSTLTLLPLVDTWPMTWQVPFVLFATKAVIGWFW